MYNNITLEKFKLMHTKKYLSVRTHTQKLRSPRDGFHHGRNGAEVSAERSWYTKRKVIKVGVFEPGMVAQPCNPSTLCL